MAYTPHTLVTISGTLSERTSADEIWQIGVRGGNTVGGGLTPVAEGQLDDYLVAVADTAPAMDAWFTGGNSHCPPSTKLTQLKAANIGADGKYTGTPHIITLNDTGGGSESGVPSYMSVCLSWTTGRHYGRKLRFGRVYPPNFGVDIVAGTSQVAAADMASLVAGARQILSALAKTGDQFSFTPMVVSSQGGYEPITGVRVGNVIDVQRRRRDAVPETYTAADWP